MKINNPYQQQSLQLWSLSSTQQLLQQRYSNGLCQLVFQLIEIDPTKRPSTLDLISNPYIQNSLHWIIDRYQLTTKDNFSHFIDVLNQSSDRCTPEKLSSKIERYISPNVNKQYINYSLVISTNLQSKSLIPLFNILIFLIHIPLGCAE